jgi:hypothetical protein
VRRSRFHGECLIECLNPRLDAGDVELPVDLGRSTSVLEAGLTYASSAIGAVSMGSGASGGSVVP